MPLCTTPLGAFFPSEEECTMVMNSPGRLSGTQILSINLWTMLTNDQHFSGCCCPLVQTLRGPLLRTFLGNETNT
eukprot:1372593-Amphidinium_carterae.1